MTNNTMNDLEQRVVATIAAALDRNPSTIEPSASLHDIGAESLDFLDIAFRLEREFHIRMPRLNVLQRAEERFGAGTLVIDGQLTPLGLRVIRAAMPEVDPARIEPGLHASEVSRLISAQTFVRIVTRMLTATERALAACPACAGTLTASTTTPEATCASCGRVVPFPPGDDVLIEDFMAAGQ